MTSHRPFPFRVRPRHRETVESLTQRVLAANGEPASFPQRLLAEHNLPTSEWPHLLHRKNRSTLWSSAPLWLQHADGTTCRQCTDLLTRRWMCTLCAHGDLVEQEPHFDTPVCVRHRRWVGFTDAPEHQRTVPAVETVDAARVFTKLVRASRLAPRLYALVSGAVVKELACDESLAFAPVVNLIAATTNAGFLHEVLNPNRTFANAHARLMHVVADALGRESKSVTRALWLAMRPAFAAARTHSAGENVSVHPHDFPLPGSVLSGLPVAHAIEPFGAFLFQTRDSLKSASQYLGSSYRRLDPATGRRHLICAHGHGFTASGDEAGCPVCPRGGAATFGVDDLTTLAPHLVSEWDPAANGRITPAMVAASSHRKYHWRCTANNHPFTATPSNRLHTGAACPVCQNRTIVPGVTDFATRFPDAFAELSPTDTHRYNPHRNTPASRKIAAWRCKEGHSFKARFSERAAGFTCPGCRRQRTVAKAGSLADHHPHLATEWVVGEDGRRPTDFSAGSSYLATWHCDTGHEYTASIERRVHGAGCPYCSGRRVLQGFNDLATTHPMLAAEWDSTRNTVAATTVAAGSIAKRAWRCRYGHETQQPIPQRIISRGCTSCTPGERVLNPGAEQAAHGPLAPKPIGLPRTSTAARPAPPEPVDHLNETEMVDAIVSLYAPAGYPRDSIVEAWAEVAGIDIDIPEPASLLRTLLTRTPLTGGRRAPDASDIHDVMLDLLGETLIEKLPPLRRLATATRAAASAISLCDGPFESEDAFLEALQRVTAL